MYVIQSTDTNDSETIYPADRCTWSSRDIHSTDGHNIKTQIYTASFYSGNAAAATISGTIRLGYLGKYGRFIPITD